MVVAARGDCTSVWQVAAVMVVAASVPFSHSGHGTQPGSRLIVSGTHTGNPNGSRGDGNDANPRPSDIISGSEPPMKAFVPIIIGRGRVANGRGTPGRNPRALRALEVAICASDWKNREIGCGQGFVPMWRWYDPGRREVN
ncbi:hypothetical protein LX36DRAFT_666277 [Colletotrichum falcatum]|nr:hypothetical protein LX36DRAFT_666277 [Colletotrichum falcatum]